MPLPRPLSGSQTQEEQKAGSIYLIGDQYDLSRSLPGLALSFLCSCHTSFLPSPKPWSCLRTFALSVSSAQKLFPLVSSRLTPSHPSMSPSPWSCLATSLKLPSCRLSHWSIDHPYPCLHYIFSLAFISIQLTTYFTIHFCSLLLYSQPHPIISCDLKIGYILNIYQ